MAVDPGFHDKDSFRAPTPTMVDNDDIPLEEEVPEVPVTSPMPITAKAIESVRPLRMT